MRWVAVLPFIDQGWADDCTSSMAPEFLANTLLVDNTRRNIGIMASHNRGIDRMREVDDPANPIGYWPDTADGGRWDA